MVLRRRILRYVLFVVVTIIVAIPVFERTVVYPRFVEHVINSAEIIAVQTGSHLASILNRVKGELRTDSLPPEFFEEAAEHIQDFRLEKMKVFSKTGMVIFSTEPKDLGTINTRPYFRDIVAKGELFTKVVRKDELTQEGRRVERDVVETYVPIIRDGRFAGAFEIYLDITDRRQQLDDLVHASFMGIFALCLILASALVAMLLRTGTDILERDTAIEKLEDSETRLKHAQAVAHLAHWDWDLAENTEVWSDEMYRILGLPVGSPANHDVFDAAVHPDDLERVRKQRQLAWDTGERCDNEFRIVRPDGAIRIVKAIAQVDRGPSNALRCMSGTIQDVTDTKLAKETLEARTRELESSNAELRQFAYVASHDLQEPLNLIEGYLDLLVDQYKGKLDAEADEFIGYTQEGVERMKSLIRDLLEYSRVDLLCETLHDIDLNDVLEEAVANLQARIDETGSVVTNDILPVVRADRPQMVRVFQNLIANAIKFRKTGEPQVVHVAAQHLNADWVISVRDNGIGVSGEGLDKIFEIFQRLHPQHEYPGTGIGLAICRRIVERHGGRIWAESEPGKGSAFNFTIPAKSE